MIKASEGGGGKGIRKVTSHEELELQFRMVQSEVPGSPIFIMKLVSNAHHLEVQILGDQYGDAISIHGRDCSIQRRHQKILEEAPANCAKPDVFKRMEVGAVNMAKAVKYEGTGTIEYLYGNDDYYFLELNPRLQVEHPCTEWISGINLPAAQLCVAMGVPLYRIPEVRHLYGRDTFGTSSIDLYNDPQRKPHGHVIAARVTAENPDLGFKPTSGQIQELTFRTCPGVWGYFSVTSRGSLHDFADSQFGHVFAWGEDRETARRKLVLTLRELTIRGDIRTALHYLADLMEHEEYVSLAFHTGWLDNILLNQGGKFPTLQSVDPLLAVVCGAMCKAFLRSKQREDTFFSYLQRGQIPPKNLLCVVDDVELIFDNVKYVVKVSKCGQHTFHIAIGNGSVVVECRQQADGGLLSVVDGKIRVIYAQEDATGLRMMIGGKTCCFTLEYDPSTIRALSPGTLCRYLVEDGSHVAKDTVFAEMEVMKMYMPLRAPESGIIRFLKREGAALAPGDVIASLELDDPSSVKTSDLFTGDLPKMLAPRSPNHKLHQKLSSLRDQLQAVITGYRCPDLKTVVDELFVVLADPVLPLSEFQFVLSNITGRLPKDVEDSLMRILRSYELGLEAMASTCHFPGQNILDTIERYAAKLEDGYLRKGFLTTIDPVLNLAKKFVKGLASHRSAVVLCFLKEFLWVENFFSLRHRDDAILELRETYTSNLNRVLEIELSQNSCSQKEQLCCLLVDKIRGCAEKDDFLAVIHDIAAVSGTANSEVSLKARQLLTEYKMPSFKQRKVAIESSLRDALRLGPEERLAELNHIIKQSESLVDALVPFFTHENADLRLLALEVYCRRSYDAYRIERVGTGAKAKQASDLFMLEFEFALWENDVMASEEETPSSKVSPIRMVESVDELVNMDDNKMLRYGMMCVFESPSQLEARFEEVLASFAPKWFYYGDEPMNVLNVFFVRPLCGEEKQQTIESFSGIFQRHAEQLNGLGMRRVTIATVVGESSFPSYFTFRARLGWHEDTIYRDIEPPLAYHLELRRMSSYNIEFVPNANRQIHLYFAQGKEDPSTKRFFVRAAVRQGGNALSLARAEDITAQVEPVFVEAVRSLETHSVNRKYAGAQSHHIFLKIINEVTYAPDRVDGLLRTLGQKYGRRLWKLRVAELELVGKVRRGNTVHNLRFVVTNPTGHHFEVCGYMEAKDSLSKAHILISMTEHGPMNALPVLTPYPVVSKLEKRRLRARNLDTTYCYDFPTLFRISIEHMWAQYKKSSEGVLGGVPKQPQNVLDVCELVLSPDESELVRSDRPVGENDIGMVAWLLTMYTPECPKGRRVVVISNDITFEIGSFGPREDMLFLRASELSRQLGVPRVYLSANSGARIGLAAELLECFQVEWEDENDTSQGFKYLYLSDEDYEKHSASVIADRRVMPGGERRWVISTVVGAQDGIGVENLRGSGMIAGETSRAYEEVFTITLATGRSVGIGAYLVRLGQRTVQNNAPVILTGAVAINKLLGRDVYTSNTQLGGPQIMYRNGVSHIDVSDDLRGVAAIVSWISYVPSEMGAPLPRLLTQDPVDREVAFMPSSQPYDPRHIIAGVEEDGHWVSGVFDKGSFVETLAGWAPSVVCGRARLGGVPVGVIAVETRTIETRKPADPANVESQELVSMNAGKVWFPDSAYKTAQAIADFNNGEELPLIIFANWRGFSGGMRDMFEEILKFGSYIVDALRKYKRPVIIYIPPYGELRGGAWVVLDPTINSDMMEMYCDELGSGGVLEPRGTVEIKYRRPAVLKTIDRLDPQIQQWRAEMADAACTGERKEELEQLVQKRQHHLIPSYQMVAIGFAELHDTPGRMKVKGAIRDVIRWRTSRSFLHARLTRRLEEERLRADVKKCDENLSRDAVRALLCDWFAADRPGEDWETDREVRAWIESMPAEVREARLAAVRASSVQKKLEELFKEDPAALRAAVKKLNL
eukprot:TRINITY_DN11939_c0_g1_i1.p1 TRINITY_DN11939_c0_g1~~TRINITY_DN11939_c0_g1_i1.p1  ORF type:complete len:2190 (+),score=948.83 TRINITY_DN11939_c0_g1_i1:693-6572(+)